jgi:hypothetical protein
VAESGGEALELLRRSDPGTFQLLLTVRFLLLRLRGVACVCVVAPLFSFERVGGVVGDDPHTPQGLCPSLLGP